MTTPLDTLLRAEIAADGPVTVEQFMRRALFDPAHGYYTTAEPFGVAGDFITAPEISQMFGELLGLWAADMWQRMGAPADVVLAEIGPGRGTLMADALRAICRAAPGMLAARPVHLIEASPRLRTVQAERLAGQEVVFLDRLSALPAAPVILIGNELLDALPIRQVARRGDDLVEIGVGLKAGDGVGASDDLTFVDMPLAYEVPDDLPELENGEVFEICEEGRRLSAALGAHLAAHGGAALLIDYGHDKSAAGETLQAVRRHAFHPVLSDIGEADLTAHVDFAAVAKAACGTGARAFGPVSQRDLLRRLGIEPRLAQLVRNAEPQVRDRLVAGYHRLTDPERMGHLFRALCLTGAGDVAHAVPPTAFETAEEVETDADGS